MRRPARVAASDLPRSVTIYEVGPRDGLQNEPSAVATAAKIKFITRLADAGLKVIEATSFVRAERVPQLADAAEVLAGLERADGVRYPVLTPNLRGLERALESGAREVAIFGSATESFAQRNLNRSVAESIEMFTPVVAGAAEAGVPVRAYLSMCFGDPWEGEVALDRVVSAGAALLDLGCRELSLGDTIGVGTPGHVTALVGAFADAGIGAERLAVHFHDTYGQALANTLAALRAGVTVVDASAGGLGGCPYAESATGNLATEDLVWMLEGVGIDTGVDLERLVATSLWMARQLGRPSPSRVVQALGGGRDAG
ncbi:MAG TPA: hydroxymethylglutaryl-CoA lyase [Egibacteraceae bacterium]|nr:hydroxymethylglutaryl-CoA lyase [Egibacteraceae bacterium]